MSLVTVKSLAAVERGVAHLRTYGQHEAADDIAALHQAFMRDVDEIRAFALKNAPKETSDVATELSSQTDEKNETSASSGEGSAPESESTPDAGSSADD